MMKSKTEIRLMTDTFRVASSDKAPLFQIPPQKGFPTVQSSKDRIPLRDSSKQHVGILYPVFNRRADAHTFSSKDADTPVCIVTESNSRIASTAQIDKRKFLGANLEPFLCAVTYGIEIEG